MNLNEQIKELSLKDKLRAMEALWDDLCHEQESLASPEWHEDILKDRQMEASKAENFTDWENAKQKIRNSL